MQLFRLKDIQIQDEDCVAEIRAQVRESAEAGETYEQFNAKIRAIKQRYGYEVEPAKEERSS